MSFLIFIFIFHVRLAVHAVPPDVCMVPFRWDDCGKAPTAVMYYWKPGSRCEIGVWRGCIPNLNMFKDEYECVSTCIFAARVRADDYHQIEKETEELVKSDENNIDSASEVEATLGGTSATDTVNVTDGIEATEDPTAGNPAATTDAASLPVTETIAA